MKVNKEMLVCDACELSKHARNIYVSYGHRSLKLCYVIHSCVGTLSCDLNKWLQMVY